MSAAEELEGGEDEQQSADEIWSERARQLVDHVKAQKPPVMKLASVHVFAMRKGWEKPTLAGILKYCVDKKLLAAYQAVSGPAFKIPLTPVQDAADGAPTVNVVAAVQPEPTPESTCLCARTAPNVNYGCPEHGRARISNPPQEKKPMAKEWITCPEAAELLGVHRDTVLNHIHAGRLVGKKEREGKRAPFLVERAKVIALRDAEKAKGDMLDEPKTSAAKTKAIVKPKPAKPARKPEPDSNITTMRRVRQPPATGSIVAKLSDEIGALREDVIMLVRLVDRGWMSQDEAFSKLREIAASL